MTDNNHPITPPPELVQQWARYQGYESPEVLWRTIATQAARWGADQELEACCDVLGGQWEWDILSQCTGWKEFRDQSEEILRAARRPKPPSLKEQANAALGRFFSNSHTQASQMVRDFEIIRRALEALAD